MRYVFTFLIMGVFLFNGISVFAAKGGTKGPSERAFERANEHASFKRDKDWTPGDHSDELKKKHEDGEEGHGDKKHKHRHHHKNKNHPKDEKAKENTKEDSDQTDDLSDGKSVNETK